MWRRGAQSDAAHHLPTAGAGASTSAAAAAAGAAVRRRRRSGLSCRPSHLFFALLVALFTASLLVVWQLLPIGDGDAAADGEEALAPPAGGGVMRFSASRMVLRAFDGESRLEAARSARRWWPGLEPVRLALVVGTMDIDAESLMLTTLAKSLAGLGYEVEVLAFAYGKAHDIWRSICRVNIVRFEKLKSVDWLNLMQEPFQLLPVVWLIHDDSLGQHLRNYREPNLSIPNHIEDWRGHFNACTYVVFPNNHLPLLYSPFDTGNFLVLRLIYGLLKDMAHHILKKL